MTIPFDWQRMLLDDFGLMFLGEVALRTLFAFIVVFVFLRVSGRRGIRQVSLFEVLIILTLGSAAGDVAFYEDVPLLPIAVVFLTMLVLYRVTVLGMGYSPRFGKLLEGRPLTIIRDGRYELANLNQKSISSDEFFMELRQQGVEHLGQVRLGILEIDGEVSLFFYPSDGIRPGLSVLPPEHREEFSDVPGSGLYACARCGHVERMAVAGKHRCQRCANGVWVKALDVPRLR